MSQTFHAHPTLETTVSQNRLNLPVRESFSLAPTRCRLNQGSRRPRSRVTRHARDHDRRRGQGPARRVASDPPVHPLGFSPRLATGSLLTGHAATRRVRGLTVIAQSGAKHLEGRLASYCGDRRPMMSVEYLITVSARYASHEDPVTGA